MTTVRLKWKILFKNWLRFALKDAVNSAFSWASIPSGAIIFYSVRFWNINLELSSSWKSALVYGILGSFAAWIFAIIIHLLILSPIKAYISMDPFKVNFDYVGNQQEHASKNVFTSKVITCVIKNRSRIDLFDCQLHIANISDTDKKNFPRFVDKFDLPAGVTKRIILFYWTLRNHPYSDDSTIGVSGPPGFGYGGNVLRLPLSKYFAEVSLFSPSVVPKKITVNFWVDTKSRSLLEDITARESSIL